jgi:hypothetical protein
MVGGPTYACVGGPHMMNVRIARVCVVACVGFAMMSCGDVRDRGPESPVAPTPPPDVTPPPPEPPPMPVPSRAVLSGVVFEPGVGPLAGITVGVRDPTSVVSTHSTIVIRAVTDGEGRFSIEAYPDSIVSFMSADYRHRHRHFVASALPGGPSNIVLPLQRTHSIEVPGSVTARLFPDDPTYLTRTEEIFWDNTGNPAHDCSPCKVFGILQRPPGRSVSVRVRWTAPVELTVSIGGSYEGVRAQRTAGVGEREVTVQTSPFPDTLLIGVASPSGIRQTIPGPIDLQIDVTSP